MVKSIKLVVVLFLLFSLASSGIANDYVFLMMEKGDIESVKEFIAETENINVRNGNGATPLHIAARNGFTDIVELLVNSSADVNAKDKNGMSLLHYALLRPKDEEALYADLLQNKVQVIEFLLAVGADENAQANDGMTPLMFFSVLYKNIENIQFISQILDIFSRADVNLDAQDKGGNTALSWAANGTNESIAAWLIQNKADVSLKDNDGMTALHWAALLGSNESIVQMLLNAGADVNTKSTNGANALWYASVGGNLDILLALLRQGAEVNLHAEGITPLHAATGFGVVITNERMGGESFQEVFERLGFLEDNFLQMTKALVEAGADVHAQSYPTDRDLKWYEKLQNRTPFDYAQDIGNKEIANYLISVMRRSRKRWYWPF